jgi:hypothetical protein
MNYVPLISSGVAGPLGAIHLPRLWQKVSLENKGLLCEGYPGIGAGFDSMVLKALNLEPDKVRQYLQTEKPTYLEFEEWVKSQPGAKVSSSDIEASNQAVRAYLHSDETRQGILKACGVSAGDQSMPRDAINLNNLEDWAEFHSRVLS